MLKSTTGYSCPNCGAICSNTTLQSQTRLEFNEIPNPHYTWTEFHTCQNCETKYYLYNNN